MPSGSLTCVGTGYLVGGQTTPETLSHLERADRLLFVAGDPVTRMWLEGLNPRAESLAGLYRAGRPRRETYRKMVERMLTAVRRGERVCVAFYGHPGVGVEASHAAIRRAREEGFEARMLPAVSAADCLYADLGLNPLADGCQSFEATDFLRRDRRPDVSVPLILWQIGAVGVDDYRVEQLWSREGLRILASVLVRSYPHHHPLVVYEAAMLPVCQPVIQHSTLQELSATSVTTASTLYMPPATQRLANPTVLAAPDGKNALRATAVVTAGGLT